MCKRWKYVLAGGLAGIANGLFGGGGGSVLVPLLTRICGMEQRRAFATSVAVILPMCALSVVIYLLRGGLDIAAAWPYLVGGTVGGWLGGRLFRLCSKTVPIGILRALDAEMIRFALESGDTVVMLSDGVSGNYEDSAWLCDMLASPAVMSAAPEEIAEKIVRAAVSGEGRRDDVTAAVVRVA